MGRPKKPDSEKLAELWVYLPKDMQEDFRMAAEKMRKSMSALCADLIRDYLYGQREQAASATEIAEEIVRLLHERYGGAEIAPNTNDTRKPVQRNETLDVDGTGSVPPKIEGANSAPPKITGDTFAPQTSPLAVPREEGVVQRTVSPPTGKRRAVNRGGSDGSGNSDT